MIRSRYLLLETSKILFNDSFNYVSTCIISVMYASFFLVYAKLKGKLMRISKTRFQKSILNLMMLIYFSYPYHTPHPHY